MTPADKIPFQDEKLAFLAVFKEEISFEGLSESLLIRAFEGRGLSKDDYLIFFPNGAEDLIAFYIENLCLETEKFIAEQPPQTPKHLLIRDAVMRQIRGEPGFSLIASRIIGKYALLSPLKAAGLPFKIADTMWRALGDTATDYNYYSKRALLANAYAQTVFFAIADTSEDFAATEAFLMKKLQNAMKLGKVKKFLPDLEKAEDTITARVGQITFGAADFLKRCLNSR